MRRLALLFTVLSFIALPASATSRVVLLQFSDYHSHAQPFYSEGRTSQGGIARAVGYLAAERRKGALVFNGGDMVNKGSPAWSDKYRCAEWSWFNGIVDAMALGNHDPDYGAEAFNRCREPLHYPVLSANTEGFRASATFRAGGVRIGVFAVAGSDFPALVKTPGFAFGDRVAAAREIVRELRDHDKADAVVLIGHESTEDDEALARAVPGIDLIFGSHSHLKEELHRIDGTRTSFLSPSQYLTYISRVEMTFDGHTLVAVRGRLVRVDASLPVDRAIAARVATMQRDLEADPEYAPLFRSVAVLKEPMTVEQLATRVVEVMRERSGADAALSTASSFRQPLPPGRVTMEDLRASLPYDNEILVKEMRGAELKRLIADSDARKGTDNYAYVASPAVIADDKLYRVAATDYVANVSPLYREFFTGAKPSGLRVREEFRKSL
jgi:5'-nucleotidase